MPGANWYSRPDRPDKRVLGAGSASHIDDDDLRELLERMLEDLRFLQETCPNGYPVYGLRAHCWSPDVTRRIYGNHHAHFNSMVLSWPHKGNRTIWLPDAVARPGGYIEVVDQAGNAATTNITVKTIKGQTISGASSFTIDVNNLSVAFRSDGEGWRAIAQSPAATASGNVSGLGVSTDGNFVLWDGDGGDTIKDGPAVGTMASETATDYLTKAGNLSGIADAATARSNIGAGTGDGDLVSTNNLSDVSSADTSLTNLGILRGMVASDFTNATTTMAAVTGMSVTAEASKKYQFEADILTTGASNEGGRTGIKFDFGGGTATITSTSYGYTRITSTTGAFVMEVTALTTDVVDSTAGLKRRWRIQGYIDVNTAGTIIMQAAANAGSGGGGSEATVNKGPWMRLTQVSA